MITNNIQQFFINLFSFYTNGENNAVIVGIAIEIIFILFLSLIIIYRNNSISIVFEMVYEKIYDFFSEVIGKREKVWIRTYVTGLFFIILFSNLIGVAIEVITPVFGVSSTGEFNLEHYVSIPSASISFNFALAIFSMLIVLGIQFNSNGIKDFFNHYIPIFGKGYFVVEKGDKNIFVYYFQLIPAKILDIILSLFLGFLEIVGLFAKVISLSFRLFGNVTSGTILLGIMVVGLNSLSSNIFGFDFPVFFPVIIYLQEILVGLIQAFVFTLIIAILVRVSQLEV